LDFM